MTNLTKLIERRQGEFQMFFTEDDGSGNDWLEMSLKEAYRQALLDLLQSMEGMDEDGETPLGSQELHETEMAWNTALQTVRAQIEGLLGKIE